MNKIKICRHKRAHGVIYNRLEDGKHISLGWCIDCGAIKRAIDGMWCGQSPKWETPAEARAQVSREETKHAREIAATKTIQIAARRLKLVRQINQRLKKLDALAALLAILLLSCGSCGTDNANTSGGWGNPCPEVTNSLTTCESTSGEVGWCAVGFCRRKCVAAGSGFTGCEANEVPTPTIENACYCVPREGP